MDDTYAEVGAEVILGRHTHKPWHTPVDTSNQDVVLNWMPAKEKYVGKKARIMWVRGHDLSGCLCCAVDVDGEAWSWRVESMYLASDEVLIR